MNNKSLKMILLSLAPIVIMGCSQPSVPSQKTTPKPINSANATMKRIAILAKEKANDNNNTFYSVEKAMYKNDSVYAKSHIKEALVSNANSDQITSKPMFLAPLFAQIKIMPYQTSDGIYHQEQTVWIKVHSGQIVLKANSQAKNPADYFNGGILNQ